MRAKRKAPLFREAGSAGRESSSLYIRQHGLSHEATDAGFLLRPWEWQDARHGD